jgi:hypothetical protein
VVSVGIEQALNFTNVALDNAGQLASTTASPRTLCALSSRLAM